MNDSLALEKKPNLFLTVLKGSLIALSISIVGILIFAFVLRFVSISDNLIQPINQVIKGVSIFIGCLISMKKTRHMGLLTGLLIGVLYNLLAFVVFSILDGSFSLSITILNDLLFGGLIGLICGIIAVNLKRRN